jgi:E3 ubiquitin-protein ligase RFWD3
VDPEPSESSQNRDEAESPNILDSQDVAGIVGILDEDMTDSQRLAVAIQILTSQRVSPVQAVVDDGDLTDSSETVETVSNVVEPPVEPPQSPQPSTSKKRKLEEEILNQSDQDDGSICQICFDQFSQIGDHRITSLKCGHIFGLSCIERWYQECPRNNKCCPHCKMKTTKKDFRYIYATKLAAVDNTREVELQIKCTTLQETVEKQNIQISIQKIEIERQRTMISDLNFQLKRSKDAFMQSSDIRVGPQQVIKTYKLCMEKNIDMARESQCRVMAYGQQKRILMVSQKSALPLFPGFGVRLIDVQYARVTQFIHIGVKSLRDMAFNPSEQLVITANQEATCKMIASGHPYTATTFRPISNGVVWSGAFDKERENYLYLGVSNGAGFIYDLRNPNHPVETFLADNDKTPVISICSIKYSSSFPLGGFFVCHLMSIWFYEYIDSSSQSLHGTKLNVSGPFISMNYCEKSDTLLLYARQKTPPAKYFLAKLVKVDGVVLLEVSIFSSFNCIYFVIFIISRFSAPLMVPETRQL